MRKFLLDTGIILGFVRGASYAAYVDKRFDVFGATSITLVSVVSKGELYSLTIQFGWGPKKVSVFNDLLNKLPVVDINNDQIIRRYAEIDAYSLSKDSSRRLPKGKNAQQMGKNDLWIAATASVLSATLITTDHDFDHISNVFLDVVYVDMKLTLSDL